MKPKCELCGRESSPELIWKNKGNQYCDNCATLKIMELEYRGISAEGEDELNIISREIEKLEDRGRGDETLQLLKKGLSFIDKSVIPERAWFGIDMGVHYFNEAMKRSDRFDSMRFFKERVFLNTRLTFVSVMLYQKKKQDAERWKFFIGHLPRTSSFYEKTTR